jgi:hypothetical protein
VPAPDGALRPHSLKNKCAVFENNIETYLASEMGMRFEPLRDACAQRLGHDRPSKALKNAEVMSDFLREAFAEGHVLAMFRQIAEKIATAKNC